MLLSIMIMIIICKKFKRPKLRLFFHSKFYFTFIILTISIFSFQTYAKLNAGQIEVQPHCSSSAIKDLDIFTEKGDRDALYEYGLLLFYGHCVEKNQKKGILSLRAAASKGHLDAAFTLGEIFSDKSQEGLHDPNEAYRYLQFAAENDHIEAQHILGIVLVRGDIYSDQQSRGLAWLGTAASEGHTFSAILLGHLYEHGRFGVKKDPCFARDWYELCHLLGVEGAVTFISAIDEFYVCN